VADQGKQRSVEDKRFSEVLAAGATLRKHWVMCPAAPEMDPILEAHSLIRTMWPQRDIYEIEKERRWYRSNRHNEERRAARNSNVRSCHEFRNAVRRRFGERSRIDLTMKHGHRKMSVGSNSIIQKCDGKTPQEMREIAEAHLDSYRKAFATIEKSARSLIADGGVDKGSQSGSKFLSALDDAVCEVNFHGGPRL
jgi:hypothetical protein